MKQTTKRLLSILLCLAMVLAMLPMAVFAQDDDPATLYVKPNANWNIDNARFAAVLATTGWSAQIWVDAADEDGDGIYEVAVPDDGNDYSIVIFCRMNPNAPANDWSNKWNQTSDLDIPTDGTNLYTVEEGSWDNGKGTWSVYTPGEAPVDPEPTTPAEPDVPAEPVYIVAGSSAAIFGTEWDPSNTANKMVDEDGDKVYHITYPEVAAGTYEFKVTDGTWSNSWGEYGTENNYVLKVSETSSVTVQFNSVEKHILVDVVPLGTDVTDPSEPDVPDVPDVPADLDYYLIGYIEGADYNGYDYKFVDGSVTVNFAQASYVFVLDSKGGEYMTEGWAGEVTSVTLKPTASFASGHDKLMIPAGEVTLSVVANEDGTLTLSYVTAEEPTPDPDPEPDVPEVLEYYLFGYINGADYGIGEDQANLGEYKFVDGQLTVKFTEESYVAVKANDNVSFYMTNGYVGAVTSVNLYKFADPYSVSANKLMVPGDQTVHFTLTENGDGSFRLSYTVDAIDCKHTSHNTDGICDTCGATVEHTYSMGVCTICRAQDPDYVPYEYYLFGFIDGADYSGFDYKFFEGAVTVTFTADAYVGIEEVNPGAKFGPEVVAQYMTDGWQGEVTSVTLYNSADLETADKLFVPGGSVVNFTMVKNDDGTLTLSYEVIEKLPDEPDPEPDPEPETNYFLAGDFNGWNEADEDYKLMQLGEVYYYGISLTAGTYEFKITNGTWDTAWPSENYWLDVPVDSDNISIMFYPETGEIQVSGVNQPVADPDVLVLGDNNVGLGSYTFTATEAGTLNVSITALSVYDEESGEWMMANPGMAFGMMFTLLVNGETNFMPVYALEVAEGDVITIELKSNMGADAQITVNLDVAGDEPVVPETKYYLAGQFNDWNECADGYQLVQSPAGDVYYFIINIAAGTHEFKITDGTWDNAWPSENYVINAAADSEITILFYPATGDIVVEGLAEPDPVPVNYYVAGTFNGWLNPDTNMLMTLNGDVYEIILDLTAGAHEFKVTDGTWDNAWPSENYYLNLESDSKVTITFNAMTGVINVDVVEIAPIEDSKDIKWQITNGTNADSATTNLRFLTWVDSLENYSAVTFNVTINGKTTKMECTTVYSAILASGVAIRNPDKVFGNEDAKYFATFTLKNIPNAAFDTPIVVTVTWTDLQGNETTSESKTIVISSDWA